MLRGVDREYYEFGPFRVDPEERTLTRDGSSVPVPPKAFDVLLVLIRDAGHLLGKDELMRAVWPDTFVEEANLAQAVSLLRKALGERPDARQFVETVPRRGYRFVAAVSHLPHGSVVNPDAPLPAKPSYTADPSVVLRPLPLRKVRVYAAVMIILATGGLLAWRMNPPPKREVTFAPITDFMDSAVAPALSPDGRTLAFIRGDAFFLSPDQIWLKMLPNGEPVQLTHDPRPKLAPAFSTDGSLLTYSVANNSKAEWLSYVVPVLGGTPQLLLSNAEGITWVGDHQLMFSETKSGIHLAVSTATDSRGSPRDVYVPEHQRGMAHYSYLSPDRRWVLVVEMDGTAAWQECRVVPFDGSSRGWQVGPRGACTSAAWSPDGKWVYLSVLVRGARHLWRQSFPRGEPQQLTFGGSEEEGIAMAPDGRSLITSIGSHQRAVWIHDRRGDRPLSSEGSAHSPKFSANGKRVYYLLNRDSGQSRSELWAADLDTDTRDCIVSGFHMQTYDVSDDNSEVVFGVRSTGQKSEIWIARTDRRFAPRQIATDGDAPYFGSRGEVVFRRSEDGSNYLFRMNRDGTGCQKLVTYPISNVFNISHDREWLATLAPVSSGGSTEAEVGIPTLGGPPIRICTGFCVSAWAPDGRYFYTRVAEGSDTHPGKWIAVAVPHGSTFPILPVSGIRPSGDSYGVAVERVIEQTEMAPGPDPLTFVYIKATTHRNLFRISLP